MWFIYLVNIIDTGNLQDSWTENKEYIENVCEITRADVDCGYDLLRGTKDEKTP